VNREHARRSKNNTSKESVVHRIPAMVLLALIGGCAGAGDSERKAAQTKDPNYRAAHLTCYQRMMAASTVGWGMTPNRHLYMMCMKDKGFDV